ncbi:MAG: anti-sigma regulatory factor [Chloroflexota bacterium]
MTVEVIKFNNTQLLNPDDIVIARKLTRDWMIAIGFSLVDQTKMVTAVSEMARNTLDHGGGGAACIEHIKLNGKDGIRLTFEDQGPGISDIDQAMRDGFSTRGSLGLGLGGSKRLVNEFEISSTPGVGTKIMILRWK